MFQVGSTSSASSSSSSTTTNNDAAWIWMTLVPLGVTSVVSICSNAISCYNFYIAWNRISEMHRRDMELLRNASSNVATQNDSCRRTEIEEAVETKLYQEFCKEKNNHNNDDDDTTVIDVDVVESSCPICLSDFEATDYVSTGKKEGCAHTFHKECLHAWLHKHPSCPYCRTELLSPVPDTTSSAAPPVLRTSSFLGW